MFKGILKISFSYREYHNCLVTISWLNPSHEMIFRQKLEKYKFHTEAIVTVLRLKASHETSVLQWCFSWLPNPRKMCVFSFIRQMWQFFKHSLFPSPCLSRTPLNPKLIFTQTPSFFKQKSLQNHFKICFLKHYFHLCLRFCRN